MYMYVHAYMYMYIHVTCRTFTDPPPKPHPLVTQAMPPKTRPHPHAPPTTSDGHVNLDAPEFDEFILSEEDMATLAAQLTDDRVKVCYTQS